MMHLKDKQQAVFGHYGIDHQLSKLKEEMRELRDAVAVGDAVNIMNELADVLNMSEQFKSYFGAEHIESIQHEKMDRQLKRIESCGG